MPSQTTRAPASTTIVTTTIVTATMVSLVVLGGCSAISLPKSLSGTAFSKVEKSPYSNVESGFQADPSLAERLYYDVRTARGQNSIVLQVVGDEVPIRILPLPPDGRSVLISQLLRETGVQQRIGAIEATLFRYNPAVIGGMEMEVRTNEGKSIRPEYDYALQPGDRIRVGRRTGSALAELLGGVAG